MHFFLLLSDVLEEFREFRKIRKDQALYLDEDDNLMSLDF